MNKYKDLDKTKTNFMDNNNERVLHYSLDFLVNTYYDWEIPNIDKVKLGEFYQMPNGEFIIRVS